MKILSYSVPLKKNHSCKKTSKNIANNTCMQKVLKDTDPNILKPISNLSKIRPNEMEKFYADRTCKPINLKMSPAIIFCFLPIVIMSCLKQVSIYVLIIKYWIQRFSFIHDIHTAPEIYTAVYWIIYNVQFTCFICIKDFPNKGGMME